MEKQTFFFEFPMTNATIKVSESPLNIKDLSIAFLKRQDEVFGEMCVIKDNRHDTIAIACYAQGDSNEIKFFTEDRSVCSIKEFETVERHE